MEQDTKIYQEDEITLKELILKVQEFGEELFSKWWIILLFVLISTGFFLYKHFNTETTYTAKLTFMVDSNEGGGFSGVTAVLAQFGLGGGKSRSNLDKILAISKSRRIVYDVLLKKVEIDGNVDYFGNFLIDIKNLRVNWKNSDVEGLYDFKFIDSDRSVDHELRDRVLGSLYGLIVGGPKSKDQLFKSDYDEDTGIMTFEVESKSEIFAARLTDSIFSHLSQFYIEKTTNKALKTHRIFKLKTDSIYNLLSGKQYAMANIQDVDRASYLRTSRVSRDRLIGEIEILTRAYAESYKNTEIAAIDLEMKTPYITTIDRPVLPLSKTQSSLMPNILLGILLGGFLGSIFLITNKIYRDVMNS